MPRDKQPLMPNGVRVERRPRRAMKRAAPTDPSERTTRAPLGGSRGERRVSPHHFNDFSVARRGQNPVTLHEKCAARPPNVLLSGAATTLTGNSAPSHRVRSN